MAWESMHFAVGMAAGGAICGATWLITRRGWRAMPLAMTLGGAWAIVPDTPRLFRQRFTGIPGTAWYADLATEHFLHRIGDLFFFHRALDAQPNNYSLHGLAGIVGLYVLSAIFIFVMYERRLRRSRRRAHHHQAPALTGSRPHQNASGDPAVLARIGKPRSGVG